MPRLSSLAPLPVFLSPAPFDGLIIARDIIRALKIQLTSGAPDPRLLGMRLDALRQAVTNAYADNTNSDNRDVYAKLTDVVNKAREDVNAGNVDVTNMTENVNKMEEYVADIARRANVGGRRRGKTRKGKGKKKLTRRR